MLIRLLLKSSLACSLLASVFFSADMGAQTTTAEFVGLAAVTGSSFYGAGAGFLWRGDSRVSIEGRVALGDKENETGSRGELVLGYHLGPRDRDGLGSFVGGGLAVMSTGSVTEEYLLVVVGLEQSSRTGVGWFAETGVAGGLRFASGYRARF